MEPLIQFVLLSLCVGGSLVGPPQLNQPSPSYVVGEQVPRLHCQMSGSNIASHVLSWYHQAPGRGPVFLLSHRAGEPQPSYGPGVSERFIAALDRDTNSFSLTIGNVNPADAGTYYCAIWFASQYIFGEGTRLIVGDDSRKKRAPQVTLLGPMMAEHPTFVCVAWGFSPEPVRLRWKVDGREPGPGEVAPPTEGQDGASIAGMLSLPSQAWLDGAQVTCRVEHETQPEESRRALKGIRRRGCSVSAGEPVPPLGPLRNGTAEDTASQSTGALSLGQILQTAQHCYLGGLAASCLASLGVCLLVGQRERQRQPESQHLKPPPLPRGARRRAPQMKVQEERHFK